jgi:DNA-binding XRE family transcriptional regulator
MDIKLEPFPRPRPHLKPPKNRLPFEPLGSTYWDHSTWVLRWMIVSAFGYLKAHQKAGSTFPSVDELGAWLLEISEPKARRYFDADGIVQRAARAAREAHEWYDPERYERSARGGRANFIELTDAQLLSVRDLSHAQAANVLHVSKRTIQRRRETFDATQAELAVLIPLSAEVEADPSAGEVIEFPETSTVSDPLSLPQHWESKWRILERQFRAERMSMLDGVEI